jgi:DUF4097 and DUF4098 domain-containing protein YvlB
MKTCKNAAWTLVACVVLTSALNAGERTQSFAAQKGGRLQVKADAGDITVKGWEKDEVYVRVTSLDEEQLKHITFSQAGGKIVIEFDWNGGNNEDVRFDVKVPSVFDIDLRTGGGDISVEAPLNGELKGSTGGGSVHLGNLGGSIRMETAGGDIFANEISGDLTVHTAGGDVAIKSIGGTCEVSTAGGSVSVETAAKSLRVNTAGGDIKIGKVHQETSLSTAGGNIEVGSAQGNISMGTAGGSISMSSGRGRVQANSSAGDVRLEKIEGSVNARTAAGDLNVSLDPVVGESSSLSTAAGNIILRIPESAKATIVARSRGPVFDFDGEATDFIRSDFPVTRPEKRKKTGEGEVVLNGGGHKIRLETNMGTIEIRKAR